MKTFFQLKRVSKSFDIIFRLPSFKKRMKKVLKITKKDSSSIVPSPRGGYFYLRLATPAIRVIVNLF